MSETAIFGPTILTADGVYFDFERPHPSAITINAIARGLANTCRFGGQCERFYSVAEHSIWVSRLVRPEIALEGLLHDAAEAFICDMPKPLKVMLPDYQMVEKRVEQAVLGVFGIGKLPPEVKQADMVMLATEQRQIMRNNHEWKWTGKAQPAEIVIECLQPQQAYEAFLERWREVA